MLFMLAVIIGLAVLVLTMPERFLPTRRNRLHQQLAKLGTKTPARSGASAGLAPVPLFQLAARLPTQPLIRQLDPVFSDRYRRQIHQRIILAGLDGRLGWESFLALKVAIPLIGLFYLAIVAVGAGLDISLLLTALMPLLGIFVPDQWLSGRVKRRQGAIERELPAVLTTLAITTEAGLHLGAAMEEVARAEHGYLSAEFRWAAEHVALGMPQGEALESMAARCGVPDLSMFVSTLVQSFEKGTSQISATLAKTPTVNCSN